MAIMCGKKARKRGGNRYALIRNSRRGRKHTYSLKKKGIIPWFMFRSEIVEVEQKG